MKLRSQLILAFVLLAIVPLTGIVVFNYLSALDTFEQLVQAESSQLTGEIEHNMDRSRQALQREWQRLEGVAPDRWELPGKEADFSEWGETIRDGIRSLFEGAEGSGAWIERFELVPEQVHAAIAGSLAAAGEAADGVPHAPRAPMVIEFGPDLLERPAPEDSSAEGAAGTTPGRARRPPRMAARVEPPPRASRDLAAAAREKERVVKKLVTLEEEIERKQAQLDQQSRATEQDGDQHELIDRAVETYAAQQELEVYRRRAQRLERVLGDRFSSTIQGVGTLHADIDLERFFGRVLRDTRRDHGEVPFALDPEGQLYTISEDDRQQLAFLFEGEGELEVALGLCGSYAHRDGWVVATRTDDETGTTFGIARPIEHSIAEMQRKSGRNLLLGIGMIGLSLFGVLPLSSRMSRRIRRLTAEANRLAAGSLDARVPVQGRDEIGQLAHAFNRMAGDLEKNQRQLLEEERHRKEQEVERRVLQAENHRRGEELEQARRFQLSMLPRVLPEHPDLEIAVYMKTATEVGGDYYDFSLSDSALTAVIGDATGHGARAGTMVTVIKTLFAARGARGPMTDFLFEANRAVKSMNLGRMTMALSLVRIEEDRLEVASAGMPPVLIHRGDGRVEELALEGLPLGAMAETSYRSLETRLGPGDGALLMSDGFPELLEGTGEPIGYEPVHRLFAEIGDRPASEVIDRLAAAVQDHTGGAAPTDDVTFVMLRRRT